MRTLLQFIVLLLIYIGTWLWWGRPTFALSWWGALGIVMVGMACAIAEDIGYQRATK